MRCFTSATRRPAGDLDRYAAQPLVPYADYGSGDKS